MNNLKNKNILELFDCLNDALSDIFLSITSFKESDGTKDEDLSNLILKSLRVIELIEIHFDDILNFDVDLVNSKIEDLIDSMSFIFTRKKILQDKSGFSEKEKQLYQNLLDNLHNLSVISLEFEKKHKIGLITFDNATLERGLKLLQEGINFIFEELKRNFPDMRKS